MLIILFFFANAPYHYINIIMQFRKLKIFVWIFYLLIIAYIDIVIDILFIKNWYYTIWYNK